MYYSNYLASMLAWNKLVVKSIKTEEREVSESYFVLGS